MVQKNKEIARLTDIRNRISGAIFFNQRYLT